MPTTTKRSDFQARPLDNMAGAPLFDPVQQEIADPVFQQLAPEEQKAYVEERQKQEQAIMNRAVTFMDTVIGHLEAKRANCDRIREGGDFKSRQEMNEWRAKARVSVNYDKNGSVIVSSQDGHAQMGLSRGKTAQADAQSAAYLYQQVFESGRHTYTLSARGHRAENELLERVVYAILDDQERLGEFKSYAREVCQLIPRHGTTTLRYQLGAQRDYLRNPQGIFEESAQQLAPTYEVYPLEDVYVTNIKEPRDDAQEGVFWIKKNVTLQDLESNERTVERDEQGQIVAVSGNFRNLEELRKNNRESSPGQTGAMDTGDQTTSFATGTLIEYEGALPISSWVYEKKLDWEVAEAVFGGDFVGFDPDPESEEERNFWGRRLGAISHWRIAYIADWNGPIEKGRLLIQAEPDAHKRPRNTLTVFRYRDDAKNFYGRSIADLQGQLEDAADLMLNANVYAWYMNAHPPQLFSKDLLDRHQTESDVVEWGHTPDGVMLVKAGQTPRIQDLMERLSFTMDVRIGENLAILDKDMENTGGVSAAAQGHDAASGTGTLGEVQHNSAKSDILMMAVVIGVAERNARLKKQNLQDLIHFLGPEGFIDYAARVSGIGRSEIQRVLPTIDGLENELEFGHPLLLHMDRAVVASLLMQLATAFPEVWGPDPTRIVGAIMEIIGYPQGRGLLETGTGMDPFDEHHQMAQGNMVQPKPIEDAMAHVMAHTMRLQELQQQPDPENPEWQNEIQLLSDHTQMTMRMLEAMAQVRQTTDAAEGVEQEEEGGASANKEGKSASKGGKGKASTPQNQEQKKSDIQGKANAKPEGGENK